MTQTCEAPASAVAGPGRDCLPERAGIPHIAQLGASRHKLVFRVILPSGAAHVVSLTGRAAWLLETLGDVGPKGLTAADLPAGLRVAVYVQRLRRAGVPIITSYEPNSGGLGGSHGRYRLDCYVDLEGEP